MCEYEKLKEEILKCNEDIKKAFLKRISLVDEMSKFESDNKENFSTVGKDIKCDEKYAHEYRHLVKGIDLIDKRDLYRQHIILSDDKKINEDCNKEIQKVCYQGLPFSYTESATKALFPHKEIMYTDVFEQVCSYVYNNKADIGVLPIENSTAGYINEIYDLLVKYDLYINYSYIKKISHCIAGVQGTQIQEIKQVYSHPQALAQCYEYIKENKFKVTNDTNTAVAAKRVAEMKDKSIACICSKEAAENYGLKILDDKINKSENYTRFCGVSKMLVKEKKHNRISLVFSLPHVVGSLDGVLSIFSYYNISLTSICSRPNLESPFRYLFYVDFEGNILEHNMKAILSQLEKELPYFKILGSYRG